MSWVGWQLFKSATASTLIILLEGSSAVLSPPSPLTPLPYIGFDVYQHISCKSFLYLGDSMSMRNNDEYLGHLNVAAKRK